MTPVAYGKPCQGDGTDAAETLFENVVSRNSVSVWPAVGHLSNYDSAESIEGPAEQQTGQHTIDTIRRFAHLLDEQYRLRWEL